MSKRSLVLAAVAVLILGLVAGGLFVMRSERDEGRVDEATSAAITTAGAPPGPADAPYVVNFGQGDIPSWRDLQLRVLTLGSLDAPPLISDGAVSQGTSLTDRVATYFERRSPNPVRRIGVQAAFPSTDKQPAVAMIIADGALPDMVTSSARPNFGVHFVASTSSWELAVWPSDGEKQRLAAGLFDARTFAGPLRYEVQREGAAARVVLPDGQTVEVRDDRIERFSGDWMVWELYQDGGSVPSARIETWWAAW